MKTHLTISVKNAKDPSILVSLYFRCYPVGERKVKLLYQFPIKELSYTTLYEEYGKYISLWLNKLITPRPSRSPELIISTMQSSTACWPTDKQILGIYRQSHRKINLEI
jgi:hypothetical protein